MLTQQGGQPGRELRGPRGRRGGDGHAELRCFRGIRGIRRAVRPSVGTSAAPPRPPGGRGGCAGLVPEVPGALLEALLTGNSVTDGKKHLHRRTPSPNPWLVAESKDHGPPPEAYRRRPAENAPPP
ncbi:predicted protein [Streptomyces sp. C]|nr:predicted protein [Streptomyces sp. C]